MDSIGFGLKPFAAAVAGVIFVEWAASFFTCDPVLVTGFARLADICIIAGLVFFFRNFAKIPGLRSHEILRGLWMGCLWSVIFGIIVAMAGVVLFLIGINPAALVHANLPSRPWELVLFLVIAGIIGPAAEELFFRGVVFGFLRKWGFWPAMIISMAAFVWAHHTRAGIPLPQLAGGIVFACAYEREKNILVPMVIHCAGNLAIFTIPVICAAMC
ncbi:MAG: CPBP family intramembrane metalloprotease [Deltaproteobacteria bacterium]|nr:CPBP family intramembrane metalloprotease [Deltaproteobacteria bacterium]